MDTSRNSRFDLLATDQHPTQPQDSSEAPVPRYKLQIAAPNEQRLEQFRPFLQAQAERVSRHLQTKVGAADLVQQTMLEAHQNISKFRGKTDLEMAKWLSRMLSNNVADAWRALRRQKRDIARERSLESGPNTCASPVRDWLQADQTSPSQTVSRSEQVARMTAAIRQLPAAQQQVVMLHHLQGKPLADVAAEINRSEPAVAGLLFRGLKSLREALR